MKPWPAHKLFQAGVQESDQVGNQANSFIINTLGDLIAFINQALAVLDKEIHGRVLDILEETVNWVKREDIFKHLELSNQTFNRKNFLDPLIEIGWIQLEYPDNLTHPNQRYKITETGRRLLSIIKK